MADDIDSGRSIASSIQNTVAANVDRLASLGTTDEEHDYITGRVARALADAIQDCETARTSSIPSDEWKTMLEDSGLDEQTQQDLAASSPQALAAGARLAVENARADAAAADRSVARIRAEHPELADAIDHALAHGASPCCCNAGRPRRRSLRAAPLPAAAPTSATQNWSLRCVTNC